jgi:hypothetical protein
MRERYIYDTYYGDADTRHVWWDYMVELHQRCYTGITVECSRNVMLDLDIDYDASKKYAMNTFAKSGMNMSKFTDFMANAINHTDVVNDLLDSEMAYYKDYGTVLFPSIVINNQTFRGQLEIEAVMNGICAGFEEPPRMCKRLLESSINDASILFYPD